MKRKCPISLEKLLKVKRCELPDDDFWERFERRLHRKILQTALCPKPSVWARCLSILPRLVYGTATIAVVLICVGGGFSLTKHSRRERFTRMTRSRVVVRQILDCATLTSLLPENVVYDDGRLLAGAFRGDTNKRFY